MYFFFFFWQSNQIVPSSHTRKVVSDSSLVLLTWNFKTKISKGTWTNDFLRDSPPYVPPSDFSWLESRGVQRWFHVSKSFEESGSNKTDKIPLSVNKRFTPISRCTLELFRVVAKLSRKWSGEKRKQNRWVSDQIRKLGTKYKTEWFYRSLVKGKRNHHESISRMYKTHIRKLNVVSLWWFAFRDLFSSLLSSHENFL